MSAIFIPNQLSEDTSMGQELNLTLEIQEAPQWTLLNDQQVGKIGDIIATKVHSLELNKPINKRDTSLSIAFMSLALLARCALQKHPIVEGRKEPLDEEVAAMLWLDVDTFKKQKSKFASN